MQMADQLIQRSRQLNRARDVEGVLRGLLAQAVRVLHADGGLAEASEGIELFLCDGRWQPLESEGEATPAAAAQRHFPGANVVEVAVPARYKELNARVALFRTERGPFDDADEQRLAVLAEVATPALEHAFASTRLKQVSQRLVDAQEEERHRLGAELNDSTGRRLAALKRRMSILQSHQDSNSPDAPLLDEAVEIANAVYEEIRALSESLQAPQLEKFGLNGSLRRQCQDFARQSGLNILYEGEEVTPLDERASTALYRLLQEALANVLEHAQAQQVVVWLVAARDGVTLSVHDDGIGIDPLRAEGAGLAGMRERLELIGGRMDIGAPPSGGTIVVGRVPVRA